MSRSPSPALRLGVLDLMNMPRLTLELAAHADRLGFFRYWLTEHPPQADPQLLIGLLGGLTERIRVGAAGILIPFHNPLLAAEGFLLLEDLYPGRIDAGFCAGGTKGELAAALLDGRPDSRLDPALYAARVEAFIGHLRGDLPSGHPAAAVPVRRYGSSVPEIWHFGTGPRSAQSAARQGTAFGYSIFHELSRDDTSLMERYRDEFQPSAARPEPLTCLAVAGVCAETEARARLLAKNSGYTSYVANVVGTPEQCREQMEELARRYGTGELAFLSLCSSHADQLRSLRLLSEAYALPAENAALRLSA